MPPRTKLTYHPYLIIAFHLRCLPDELRERIPRSTRFDWSRKELSDTFGFEWACGQEELFNTLQQVAASQKLLRVNLALLRIIAIKRFLHRYASRLSGKEVQRVRLLAFVIMPVKTPRSVVAAGDQCHQGLLF